MRISDWSSDVCSSDLWGEHRPACRGVPTSFISCQRHFSYERTERVENNGSQGDISTPEDPRCVSQGGPSPSKRGRRLPCTLQQIGRASWRERLCQYV